MISESDTYLTIKESASGEYKDKGSRFLSYSFPIASEPEAKKIIQDLRNKYHDARHHCFAYRIGFEGEISRLNDDGEPSGTAGKPIMGQLLSKNITNVLVVVVRYFGGILLGTSGLIHAYRSATIDALSNSEIIEKTIQYIYQVNFQYEVMNTVMKILKEEKINQFDQNFDLSCNMKISVRKNQSEQIIQKLQSIQSVVVEFSETR
ncbi:MAG: YigZ family protein [Bacteroidota bacterium]|nr:YigZ family protein [Bacteroidota bacterium]MDP4273699.1 YigZ family protein [Bacteroidota bacterium]